MSAKFMFSLSDENPDLQKQIGCMNGLFHFLGSQRNARPGHKRLPPGQNGNHGTEPNIASQKVKENNLKKAVKEKQRFSFESPRTSCSSSSYSSSFSSADCSKASQVHRSSVSQPAWQEIPSDQPNASLQPSQRTLDVQNVVKESIYREACGLSIKTATKVEAGRQKTLKYIDSPRPLQSPKPARTRNTGLDESNRVLAKLQEAPRMSNGCKDGPLTFSPRDAPRFSYDERGSQDGLKIKLKDLPRLSLDSRESSIKGSINGMKSNFLLEELNRSSMKSTDIRSQQQEPGSYKGPSSVVAKLMGLEALEALPNPKLTNGNQSSHIKTCDDPLSHSSRIDESKKNWLSGSLSNLEKEPSSPRLTIADTKKPIASGCPIEPAPWKQLNGSKGQMSVLKCQETPMKSPNSSVTVYGEIGKRLAELEFKKSGKDLRALKQILEAIQKSKHKSETRKEDQASNFISHTNRTHGQSSEAPNLRKLRSSNAVSVTVTGTSSPKHLKSPITVIKPEKFRENTSNSTSSVVRPGSLSRLRISSPVDTRKEKVDRRRYKDSTPRPNLPKDPSSRLHSRDKNTSRTLRFNQTSKELSPTAQESPKLAKSSETTCLKVQLKKLELEKQYFRTSSTSSEKSRSRRQSSRLQAESGLPHRKSRHKSHNLQQNDDQLSDISSDMRDLSNQGDASSMKSDSNMSAASYGDIEVTRADRSCKIKGTFSQKHENKQNNPAASLSKGDSTAEPARTALEQPSPVSVLDATFYGDESLSPAKKKSNAFKDDEGVIPDEADWSTIDLNHLSSCRETSLNFKTDYKKEDNIQQLVRKFMNLDSIQDWSIINEIAPVCNSSNLDHKYIAEVLLASSLLNELKPSFMAYQLHPSYHCPIDPTFFPALEQTKAIIRRLNGKHNGRMINQLESIEKNHRHLIFDAINEVLVRKLQKEGSYKQWFSPSILEYRRPRKQQLIRDLYSDIDKLQNAPNVSLDDDDDGLKSTLWGDLMLGSIDWTECSSEIPWVVLDVERLIFKDLICEVVSSETANPQGQPGQQCSQLF